MNNHISVDDQLKQIIMPNGKSLYHVQLRRSRITAIVLAMSAVVTLIFFVFSFVQKAAADVARQEAVKNEVKALKQEELARQLSVQLQQCRQVSGK